ncbi:MAM [Echinococcus multilocularis]|uniref:MAM n=1 Tax=Echinococcus multilocularis TaxID=6211 RepID=A0A087W1A7_ECHMU|nr:MAM [Echinococcus multilocularis]
MWNHWRLMFSYPKLVCMPGKRLSSVLHTWKFDEDLADWTNDLTNWHHKWQVEWHQLCLAAKPASAGKNQSPWSSSTRKKLSDPSAGVQARLWSSPIPSEVRIGCLTLSFLISGVVMGRSVDTTKTGDSIKPNFKARLLSPPIPSYLSLRCLAIAYAFDLGPGLETPKAMSLSLLQRLAAYAFISHVVPLPFHKFICPAAVHLQMCRIRGATSLTCGFENGSLCEWGNDLNNWLATWQVDNSTLCFKPLRQHFKSKTELFARLYSPFLSEEDAIGCVKFSYIISITSSRSGSVQQSAREAESVWPYSLLSLMFVSCVDGRTNSFSCDFESPGMQSFCHWNIDPRDSGAMWGIVWSPNLHTNMLCLTPTALSLSAAGVYTDGDDDAFDLGEINATAMRARFWSPKFRIAWTDVVPRCINFLFKFDQPVQGLKSLCGWKDDPRDNGVAWIIVWNSDLHTNSLCMTLATSSRYVADDDGNFGFGGINEPVMQARLWSPKFHSAKSYEAPQCVEFSFKFDQLDAESSSLSVMRHSVRSAVSGFHASFLTFSMTYKGVSFILALNSLFEAVSTAGKSPLDCHFDNACSWMPDPRDSTAKWQIENGTMCLRPVSLPQHFESFSDLVSSHSDRRARLWSTDIRFYHNVQCLCFVYSLSSTPVDKFSLSVLLHSSGNCQKILDAITGQEFEVCRPVLLWNSSMSRAPSSSSWNTALIDLGTDSSTDFKKFARSIGSGYREDASN